MSASYDRTQKFKFVYESFYVKYLQGTPHVAIMAKPQTPPFEQAQERLQKLESLHAELTQLVAELEALGRKR